ncbi:MAG: aminotransferase class I/II-fold pyridoxal phosphate-dependent enzyme [Myxococcota bacterium]
MIDARELQILQRALTTLAEGFEDLPAQASTVDVRSLERVLQDVAVKMRDNYPYHHPMYAGQMLKPPHPVARMAYMLSMWVNPNNHALDGGRASSALEKICVRRLGEMFGFEDPLGHLCGGGTMANLEALWVAGRLAPGKHIVASQQAHYTHGRISEVLQLDFDGIPVTPDGRMDVAALDARLEAGDVGAIVATLGTTGIGSVDPLDEILTVARKYGVRVHVDAAYGGYFTLSSQLDAPARRAYDAIAEADSVVVDPHKHGLQPYGCGCVLFRDRSVGALYKHDSPYTYFSSAELHLGEISLECSRAGASAVALWATQELMPMDRGGEFAGQLDRCLMAARSLGARLEASSRYRVLMAPEIDIVLYAPVGADAQTVSERSRHVFEAAAKENLHLALIELPPSMVAAHWPDLKMNRESVCVLRSCLMKPEHAEWADRIVDVLEEVAQG